MDRFWSVEDVMDYFGEELKTVDEAKRVMGLSLSVVSNRGSYFAAMHGIREILMREGHEGVPFRAKYRRVKK